jgi:hypothetical protein
VAGTYEKITQTAQGEEITGLEKIDQIVQAIDQYQKEIDNLLEEITPTTAPVVKEKRKKEVVEQL